VLDHRASFRLCGTIIIIIIIIIIDCNLLW